MDNDKKEKYIDTKVIDATDKNTYAYSQITSFITDTTYLRGIKEPESDTVIIVCDTLKYRLNKDTLYFENPFLVRTFGDTLAIIPKKKSDTTVLFKLLRLNKLPRYDSLHFEYRFPH